MSIKKLSMLLLSALSCAALISGCGSSSKAGSATTGNVARVADEGTCRVCHSATTDPVSGTNIGADWTTSVHNGNDPLGCQGCHGGGAEHNGVGPIPFPNPLTADRCITCHNANGVAQTTQDLTPLFTLAKAGFVSSNCAHCHTASGVGSVHAAQVPTTDDCVYCHDVAAPQHGANLVNDNNNGVRAIVPEFNKTSHHIVNANGAQPTKAQCVVCHAEGTVSTDGTSVVIDSNFHMKDGNIYLRNGNTTLGQTPDKSTNLASTNNNNVSVYVWNPATPDHSTMDQFCFSCHNSSGAPDTYAALGKSVTGLASSSETNPFGDTISNGYDQMSRSKVVNVFDAFNPTNPSHHAVRGKKYSGRTRATVTNPAGFTTFSGAAVNPSNAGPDTNGNAGIGPKSPGSRYTIYEAGFFVSNYTPLGASATVADDSTLHCGDCHTVGQWKPNSTTAVISNADGTTTPVTGLAAIGAHGSVNEYMLRTSDGVDAIQHQAAANGTSLTDQTRGGNYVCFLCHKQGVYGEEEYIQFAANRTAGPNTPAATGGHGGMHPCNDASNGESSGLTGSARVTLHNDGEFGGGNLFGYTCGHCHNAGNTGFGGIHGSNAAWGIYSASQGYASAVNTTPTVQYRKSYRFMGGLSLRYNGGGTAAKWESQVLQKSNREGCYNFAVNNKNNGATPPVAKPLTAIQNEWVVDGVTGVNGIVSGATSEFTDGANGSQSFGTWGACSHHNGTSTTGSNAVSLRKVQRPLSY